jgi:hypothetical protein
MALTDQCKGSDEILSPLKSTRIGGAFRSPQFDASCLQVHAALQK